MTNTDEVALDKEQRALVAKITSTGPKAGPGKAAVRRLMLHGVAAGLTGEEVDAFANPAFYRGINDPFGRGGLIDEVTDADALHTLAAYAASCKGTGLVNGGSTKAQSAFFDHFDGTATDYRAKYQAMVEAHPPGSRSRKRTTTTTDPDVPAGHHRTPNRTIEKNGSDRDVR